MCSIYVVQSPHDGGEQMNWMAEQFGIFENRNLALQCHHVAIWCKLLTRTKHVILMLFLFWNHIINKVIKYCLTVCPIIDRCVTRSWLCVEGSCEVHVMVNGVRRVKRTSSRPGNNAHDALTIYRGNVTMGERLNWQRMINKLYSVMQLCPEKTARPLLQFNLHYLYSNIWHDSC